MRREGGRNKRKKERKLEQTPGYSILSRHTRLEDNALTRRRRK
jgi:hypothetical protein